jgi:hypothetical protein
MGLYTFGAEARESRKVTSEKLLDLYCERLIKHAREEWPRIAWEQNLGDEYVVGTEEIIREYNLHGDGVSRRVVVAIRPDLTRPSWRIRYGATAVANLGPIPLGSELDSAVFPMLREIENSI